MTNKTIDLFLIPPQIQDSCKLALPEGLKDLMSDITREVLRYQPRELYKFIADYLSALLITRDNLSIAGRLCKDICQFDCQPELQRELSDIGLTESEITVAIYIITNYFEKGPVQESNLMLSLIKETSINEDMIPALQNAIRNAFLRHQAHNTTIYESSSDSEQDEMMCAAKHTLDLYRKTAPNKETYEMMAEKIQKSYRAYGVRRECEKKDYLISEQTKTGDKSVTLNELKSGARSSYDIVFPKTMIAEEVMSNASWPEDKELEISSSMNAKRITTISSTSLAGSYLTLPSYKPYSAHDCDVLSNLEEFPEREHAYIDYTDENPHVSMVTEDKEFYKRSKKISFNDDEAKMGLEVDDDSVSRDETDPDAFFHGQVMKIDGNDDQSAELDRNRVYFYESPAEDYGS